MVRHAAQLLGAQIRQARVERHWSIRELADRAGVSTGTLLKVEHGDPSVSLGIAFDVANLVGVPLFYEDPSRLADEVARSRERLALLPQRVRERETDVDDAF
ncbi:MAG: helix-turn-helix domain-containing protein [Actinomycetota bacterium]|nr:helix-turn-helix domain-containing protein [Actinomycetota bacterium]